MKMRIKITDAYTHNAHGPAPNPKRGPMPKFHNACIFCVCDRAMLRASIMRRHLATWQFVNNCFFYVYMLLNVCVCMFFYSWLDGVLWLFWILISQWFCCFFWVAHLLYNKYNMRDLTRRKIGLILKYEIEITSLIVY